MPLQSKQISLVKIKKTTDIDKDHNHCVQTNNSSRNVDIQPVCLVLRQTDIEGQNAELDETKSKEILQLVRVPELERRNKVIKCQVNLRLSNQC
jgi:hypothetical protein